MPNSTEWATARTSNPQVIEPGAHYDAYGSINHRHAIALDTGSSTMIIEGTPAELRAWAEKLVEILDPSLVKNGVTAGYNVPGFLPESEPHWYPNVEEAWSALHGVHLDELDDLEQDPDADETNARMRSFSQGLLWEDYLDPNGVGTIHGPRYAYWVSDEYPEEV
jgi:hypothetical protein